MAKNFGKQFELKFKEDWLRISDSIIDRLYDTTAGYKSISQISDYIGYVFPNIFYLEVKSIHGNTFPFTNLTQYEKLKCRINIPGVRVGVIIWFVDHGRVFYVPISTIKKMKEDNKKSVNVNKSIEEGYNIIEVPSTKKRIFCDSDYSVLLDLMDGE